jgi:hypothetical protein
MNDLQQQHELANDGDAFPLDSSAEAGNMLEEPLSEGC